MYLVNCGKWLKEWYLYQLPPNAISSMIVHQCLYVLLAHSKNCTCALACCRGNILHQSGHPIHIAESMEHQISPSNHLLSDSPVTFTAES